MNLSFPPSRIACRLGFSFGLSVSRKSWAVALSFGRTVYGKPWPWYSLWAWNSEKWPGDGSRFVLNLNHERSVTAYSHDRRLMTFFIRKS